jgi:hypothetical protein
MEAPDSTQADSYEMLVSPSINEWRGRRSVQCQIHHYQPRRQACEKLARKVPVSIWRSGLYSQLLEEHEEAAIQVCRLSEHQAKDWLTEDSFGTLVLAHSPKGLSILEDVLLHTQSECPSRSIAAQNTLIMAPDYEKIIESKTSWKRILMIDEPICINCAKILAKELHCEQIGIIMNNNLDEGMLEWEDFGEDTLRKYFVALRQMLMKTGSYRSRESALAMAADAMALDQARAKVVLRIFRQLELICFERSAPYLAMLPGKKVNLTDSSIYRLCIRLLEDNK